jgi:alpha-amylase
MSKLIHLLLIILPLCACGGGSSTEETPSDITDTGTVTIQDNGSDLPELWARKAVFMEIYVRGYRDSDGDGIGDLQGVIASLDYLQDLGIGGIWLMPITVSSDNDHGYAVTNYRDIEADYGSLEDMQELIAAAHLRGIGVIMDYVINHSSSSHPIFEHARADKTSDYRDWYVWSSSKPSGWSNWGGLDVWHTSSTGYYYGVFTGSMPDFNWENDYVTEFHDNNLRYWLNLGIDGFRFDAVGVLIENGANAWENQTDNYGVLTHIQDLLADYDNRYMVCESPSAPDDFSSVGACGSAFAFSLQYYINDSAKNGVISDDMVEYLADYKIGNMAPILANHDSFAGDRLYEQFDGDINAYKMAAATLLTLPGTPFVYYGEEIGMSHSTNSGDNDADHRLRGPMSWTGNTKNGGFSTDNSPFRKPADNVANFNVEDQQGDPESLLNWYKTLIAVRNEQPALSLGTFTQLDTDHSSVFAFKREYAGDVVYVAINYGNSAANVSLDAVSANTEYTALFPSGESNIITTNNSKLALSLGAQQAAIYYTQVDGRDAYGDTTLYLRGNLNSWAADDAYKFVETSDHHYTVSADLTPGGYAIKVADANWSVYNFGAVDRQFIELGEWQTMEYAPEAGDDIQFTITDAGTHVFELDTTDPLRPRIRVSSTP